MWGNRSRRAWKKKKEEKKYKKIKIILFTIWVLCVVSWLIELNEDTKSCIELSKLGLSDWLGVAWG